MLLRAGAAVNAENNIGETPLFGSLRAWECNSRCFRVWPILLRAGASLPADPDQFMKYLPRQYMQKVIDAGGWANYEPGAGTVDRVGVPPTCKTLPSTDYKSSGGPEIVVEIRGPTTSRLLQPGGRGSPGQFYFRPERERDALFFE